MVLNWVTPIDCLPGALLRAKAPSQHYLWDASGVSSTTDKDRKAQRGSKLLRVAQLGAELVFESQLFGIQRPANRLPI